MSTNLRKLSARKGLKNNLFESIQKCTVPTKQLASNYLIGESNILGAQSFYDFLNVKNIEKKVFICNGTACLTSGKQDKVKKELLKYFSESEIGQLACLGHCHTNAAFLYDGQSYSLGQSESVKMLIENKKSNKSYKVYNLSPIQILTKEIEDIFEFYQILKDYNRIDIIKEIKKSQIRGRGGAGFPLGLKIEACADTLEEQKYIVCNADEGDPGAFSDMFLLEQNPHLVLFGMMAAAKAVKADMGILYVRAEYPDSIQRINSAILELRDKHIIGDDFDFKVIKGAGAYICGEETALLNSIEGLRPEVRVRPPFPAQSGLYGQPTVLSNVESFANLHWILEQGGNEFANVGTKKTTGTKLVSLDGFFKRPGIYEVEMGYSFQQLVEDAGGFIKDIKAIQVGGPLGGVLPTDKISKLNLDFESFSKNGFLLGHAGVVCIPRSFPMIDFIKHLFEFTKDESCGKCYPCRLGSARGFEMLNKAIDDDIKMDKELFSDLLETMELGSLCALGGGLSLPIKNILQYFDVELKSYFQ